MPAPESGGAARVVVVALACESRRGLDCHDLRREAGRLGLLVYGARELAGGEWCEVQTHHATASGRQVHLPGIPSGVVVRLAVRAD